MSTRQRILVLRALWLVLVFIVLLLGAADPRWGLGLVILLALWARLERLLLARAFDRAQSAIEGGHVAEGRARFDDLVAAAPHMRFANPVGILEGTLLLRERNYEAARVVLRRVDRRRLGPTAKAHVACNLATATQRAGHPDEVIALVTDTLRELPDIGAEERAGLLGAHGMAEIDAGRYDAAIRLLEESLALGGKPVNRARHEYSLGVALENVGRHAEAHAAYDRAHEAHPSSRGAADAAARLRQMPPAAPYRG
jgi:tetratricopeptide (TPR) repeat protein